MIVGIGASAGGLEAFKALLASLPPDTGMAFVYVQHLDPHHESLLGEILTRSTAMPVAEARHGMVLAPNHVYVIPPNTNMVVADATLQLSRRRAGMHHPIDEFLRSLAADQRHLAIGVILSGTATDGTLGLSAIKGEGGITFAQDDSAKQTSMPHSAIAADAVDFVLPPQDIAEEIVRIARHPYLRPAPKQTTAVPVPEARIEPVLEILRRDTGVDFSNYRFNSLYRRITRRIVLHKLDSMSEYVRLLRDSAQEREALYQDILIGVTSFFRDPEAYEWLKANVYPRLVQQRGRNEPVRIWVVGCSTGEEAYSIAISFVEYAESLRRHVPLQIFATDVNGAAVERARTGVYTKNIAHDVSPERLRRFFVEIDGRYQISKPIRDACVFARHNVLTDPPFSRIDLVSCRNLLIYLEPVLQKRVVPLLHYALKPTGFLWLGVSESIGPFGESFEIQDGRHKVYAKMPRAPRSAPPALALPVPVRSPASAAPPGPPAPAGDNPQAEIDQLLLSRYAPPGVVVNGDMEVLQFRGDTGHYLAPRAGRASFNLFKMLREGLLAGVRGAVTRARSSGMAVREEGLRVKSNGGYRTVDVEAIPLTDKRAALSPGCMLVLFQEKAEKPAATRPAREAGGKAARSDKAADADLELERSRRELIEMREYLQSLLEQQEAANEELQSANEEVQSANEELQSVNEELETSKEEIQSTNEELVTLNEELQHRNRELNLTNNDLVNLIASVQMAIVMLGPDLRIRRFTPTAEKLLHLIPSDVGRPVSDVKLKIEVPDLERMLADTIDTVSPYEREVRDEAGRWYSLRVRPYRTLDNKIDGAVLVLVDVDALKRAEQEQSRLAMLLDHAFEPMFMWRLDGTITYWNKGAEEFYGYPRAQAIGARSHELLKIPSPRVYLDALNATGRWIGELTHTRRDGSQVAVDSRMVLAHEPEGPLVIETNRSASERHAHERALAERARELERVDRARNQFLAMLAHELRNPLAPLRNAAAVLRMEQADADAAGRAKAMIERQVGNLSRLVDDLLDIARVTQDHIQLRRETFDLRVPLNSAIDTCRPNLEARRQTLEASLPPGPLWVRGDPLRMEQIVTNLLDNASKYTAAEGHVWLTAERIAPADREWIAVRVRDDGIGISAETLPHVFDLFMQADRSPARSQGGLGIGLTLVRRLVELHGGRVEAASAGIGRGSTFTMRLPAATPPRETTPPPREPPAPTRAPRRVLVVDDAPDTAASMAMLLELLGHEVRVESDGAAALEAAATFRPEVVILDIGLPRMDGYEVARRLRALPGGRDLHLVAVSGYGQPSDIERAKKAGFDRHFVKPLAPEELRQLLTVSRSAVS